MDVHTWTAYVNWRKYQRRVQEAEKKNDEAWTIAKKKVGEDEAIKARGMDRAGT